MSYRALSLLALTIMAGCSVSAESAGDSSEQDLVGDIASMTARGDGSFDVVCRDGVKEIATASNVSAGNVCVRAGAGECSGTPMTAEQALAKIPAGKSETTLGRVTLNARAPLYQHGVNTWLDASTTGGDSITGFRVYARIKNGSDSSRDVLTMIPLTGSLVLKAKDGVPYLRIESDAATAPGADSTHLVRIVSNDLRLSSLSRVEYTVEMATAAPGAAPTWKPAESWNSTVEAQYSVRYYDGSGGSQKEGIYPYVDAQRTVVTERCAQIRFREETSSLASVSAALNVSSTFAN